MSITATPALEFQLEQGLHTATLIKVSLKTKMGRGGAYTAFQLTFANEKGGEASAMLAHFTGKIPTAFNALGDPLGIQEEITPERLMALRGRDAEIKVVHRQSNGRTFANVTAINGVVIS